MDLKWNIRIQQHGEEAHIIVSYKLGSEMMNFNFSFGKKPKKNKLICKFVNQRIQHKKVYQEQLDRLDSQLQLENIDQLERERLRTILEAKFYEQQQEDLEQLQELLK